MKRKWIIGLLFSAAECLTVLLIYLNSSGINNKSEETEDNSESMIDIVKELPKVRIRLLNTDYSSAFHPEIALSCKDTLYLKSNGKEQIFTGGQRVIINGSYPFFENGVITASAANDEIIIDSIMHNGKAQPYKGILELYNTQGGIAVVNSISIEDYTAGVISSEMPDSYGIDAAMLQAVCSRTYIYNRLINNSVIDDFGSYADDSVNFQVYNKCGIGNNAKAAVEKTKGMIMLYDDKPIVPYYFSTSCGYTSDNSVWSGDNKALPYLECQNLTFEKDIDLSDEKVFSDFIQNWDYPAYECNMAWNRWMYGIDRKTLGDNIGSRLKEINKNASQWISCSKNIDEIINSEFTDVETEERKKGGSVSRIKAVYDDGTISAEGELNIRYIMGAADMMYINKSDEGNGRSENNYLPSAFFTILSDDDNYTIVGGGNGHGVGLSQNAAFAMLDEGKDWKAVLKKFYKGIELGYIKMDALHTN